MKWIHQIFHQPSGFCPCPHSEPSTVLSGSLCRQPHLPLYPAQQITPWKVKIKNESLEGLFNTINIRANNRLKHLSFSRTWITDLAKKSTFLIFVFTSGSTPATSFTVVPVPWGIFAFSEDHSQEYTYFVSFPWLMFFYISALHNAWLVLIDLSFHCFFSSKNSVFKLS